MAVERAGGGRARFGTVVGVRGAFRRPIASPPPRCAAAPASSTRAHVSYAVAAPRATPPPPAADDELLAKLKGVLPARATHLVAQAAPCVEILVNLHAWGA